MRVPPARRVLAALLAGASILVLLRLIHVLLFRQYLDRPLVFAGWMAAGLAAIGALAAIRTAWRSGRPAPGRRSTADLAMAATIVSLVAAFHFAYLGVASDGRDYFVQAHSIVFDGDLDITPEEIAALEAPGQARHYPVGAALLWSPFLAAAHGWVVIGNLATRGTPYPANGYGGPYEVAIGLATLFYGCVGLLLAVRVLRGFFPPGLAVLATVAVAGGSFVLWYLVVEASMSHGVSMFAVTLFFHAWQRARVARSPTRWAALGAAAGLMTIVRWQNFLFVAVALPDIAAGLWRARREGRDGLRAALVAPAAAAAAGMLTMLPQFWLWHRNHDGWLAVPDERFTLNWAEPAVGNVLFSPLHGLTTWSPLIYLSLIGLVPLVWRRPRMGGALVIALAGQLYANSMIEVWWAGSSFGARRFAACTLVFAAGLAALIEWATRRPIAAAAIVVAPFVAANVLLVQHARSGRLSLATGATAADVVEPIYELFGNPFSFPANALFALEHGVPLSAYDRIGTRVYQRLFIDVGGPHDDLFLTYGWSARERGPAWSYRWAVGEAAGLAWPISKRADYRLRVRVEPFMPPGTTEQATLTVLVNGERVGTVPLEPAMAEYDVAVPRGALRPNLNHLRFTFSRSASPREAGLSADSRPLAVSFDSIELVRAGSGPGP